MQLVLRVFWYCAGLFWQSRERRLPELAPFVKKQKFRRRSADAFRRAGLPG